MDALDQSVGKPAVELAGAPDVEQLFPRDDEVLLGGELQHSGIELSHPRRLPRG
jgi:hypothetical protein